jgi:hypothetical protein
MNLKIQKNPLPTSRFTRIKNPIEQIENSHLNRLQYSGYPEIVEVLRKNRWKQCPEFEYERVNFHFLVKKFFD